MATTQEYVDLIPSANAHQPNFVSLIELLTGGPVDTQNCLLGFPVDFDLDYAVGVQLDAIGDWVGVSRFIVVPLTGVYFTWNGTDLLGWDSGSWQGPFDPSSGVVSLPDDSYRILLRAKIAANHWDGTIPGAYAVWDLVFAGTGLSLIIIDGMNMTMAQGLFGRPVTALEQALLSGGYLDMKPAAVRITDYFVPVDTSPLFAWDLDTPEFAGWETGSWVKFL